MAETLNDVRFADAREINTQITRPTREALRRRARTCIVQVTSPVAATSFTVKHALGRKPTSMLVSSYEDGVNVWATVEDRARWDASSITVACSSAGKTFDLILLYQEK
jgi:hypothetical protein